MKKEHLKQKFISLRSSGLSYREISDQLGISKQTLINWSKELSEDIANLKAVEHDALLQEYAATRRSRIKQLGVLLERIETEIASRDFKNIKTEDLIQLMLKTANQLDRERAPTVFTSKQSKANIDLLLDAENYIEKVTWEG